ncbi:MAG: CDP-glucose 4,6-dehydratase [Defluviitaleaceae bacterium]|nr:CDP-glucose 4,6-dehydratase [Defluviitaleaceae bacterium]
MVDLSFFKDKKVFLTGHTGFKGSWLSRILINAGAELTGYALSPPVEPNLFSICGIDKKMNSFIGDVRDKEHLFKIFKNAAPEIVIHMAAQPLVRESYKEPVYTYETNVMGTVNLLECIRIYGTNVKSVLNVTTDKVYLNNEWYWGYRENDPLDGFDPYSNSKSCSELVTHAYNNSFFRDAKIAISTARAGNVIGGGDFAIDRIIPDCIRAASKNKKIIVRNPYSIRPYQHVLEPLFAYLMIAKKQHENREYAGYYNVGPDDCDCITTGQLVDTFCKDWGGGQTWENQFQGGPYEANFLKLDCAKIKSVLDWNPKWNYTKAVEQTIEWTKAYLADSNICEIMDQQVIAFINY